MRPTLKNIIDEGFEFTGIVSGGRFVGYERDGEKLIYDEVNDTIFDRWKTEDDSVDREEY